jgi:hypothetical protein
VSFPSLGLTRARLLPDRRLKYKSPHATDLSFAKDET